MAAISMKLEGTERVMLVRLVGELGERLRDRHQLKPGKIEFRLVETTRFLNSLPRRHELKNTRKPPHRPIQRPSLQSVTQNENNPYSHTRQSLTTQTPSQNQPCFSTPALY